MKEGAELDGLLSTTAERWGLKVGEKELALFREYLALLQRWNKKVNLTAVTEPREVYARHFLDSLSLLAFYSPQQGVEAVDIGTGAGFPGVPVKIVREDIEMALVEAALKKVIFLENLVNALGLKGIRVVRGRAEELGREEGHREKYGLALARAVAPLPALLEYALPLVRVGGCLVAYKGPGAEKELEEGKRVLEELGGEVGEVKRLHLPYLEHQRTLVFVKKVRATPAAYPRRASAIKKRPLK